MPTISIITSAYRAERFLPTFLESVASQTVIQHCELVLCLNDASERELQIVAGFRDRINIQLITVPREGLPTSTNRCIKAARGTFLALWNVDDLRYSHSLHAQHQTLLEHSDCSLTYGSYYGVTEFGQMYSDLVTIQEDYPDQKEFRESMICGPFYMWRKSLSDRIGGWNEHFERAADFDWNMRAARVSRFVRTPTILGSYLIVGGLSNSGKVCSYESQIIYRKFGIHWKHELEPTFPEAEYRARFADYLDGDQLLQIPYPGGLCLNTTLTRIPAPVG